MTEQHGNMILTIQLDMIGFRFISHLVNGDHISSIQDFKVKTKLQLSFEGFGGLFYDLGNYAGSVSVSAPAELVNPTTLFILLIKFFTQ